MEEKNPVLGVEGEIKIMFYYQQMITLPNKTFFPSKIFLGLKHMCT